jgi:hypothetical protein
MLKPGWRGWFTGWESACGRPHSERVAERVFGITSRDDFSTPFLLFPTHYSKKKKRLLPSYLTHNTSPYTPNNKKAKWVRRREPLKGRVVEYRAQQCSAKYVKGVVCTRRVGRGEHIRLSADRLPRIQVKDPLLGKCHPSAISLKTEVEFNFARIILRILLSSATSARSSKSFGAWFFIESGWASHLRVGDGRFCERVRRCSPSAKFQQFPYPTTLRIFVVARSC